MTNEEWEEKYAKMLNMLNNSEIRIKHLDDMLVKSMEMNRKLIDLLQDNKTTKFNTVGTNSHWNMKCPQCGCAGFSGLACPDHNCPNRATCRS